MTCFYYKIISTGHSAPSWDMGMNNVRPEFDLSRSVKANFNNTYELSTYDFLSTFNCDVCSKYDPSRQISLKIWDHDLDISRSLKIQSHGVLGLPIYDFLLVSNNNHISCISLTIQLLWKLEKFPPISYHGAKISDTPYLPLPLGDFVKLKPLQLPGSQERAWSLFVKYFLRYISVLNRQTTQKGK